MSNYSSLTPVPCRVGGVVESAFQSESISKPDFTFLALLSSLSHVTVWEVGPPDSQGWAHQGSF